ncbi:MAG: cyclic nucleotide-binding/CBS domain-containing protein [Magnetococcales bacterium]|nr:cyclic nucleotide-binding/CBS domain-containing protein [Magnetococcales bacterium]
MEIELIEILEFLTSCPPFDILPEEVRQTLPATIHIRYARRGAEIMAPGDALDTLQIIRTGAVEIYQQNGHLITRLDEGTIFGAQTILRGGTAVSRAEAIEDTLIYQLSATVFQNLCRDHAEFRDYFGPVGADRLRSAVQRAENGQESSFGLMASLVVEHISRKPVCMSPDASVKEAARLMTDAKVSSILLVEEGGSDLVGILTDQDLRTRVVAEGVSLEAPVRTVMSQSPTTISAHRTAFDAMLIMAQHNQHHLPVHRAGKIIGVVSPHGLLQNQCTSVIFMVSEINKQRNVQGLVEVCTQIPQLLVSLSDSGTTAQSISHAITVVTDTVTRRLLRIAERIMGPAPVPFAWAAAGSQARDEQTIQSDQDHCLLIDDSYVKSKHGQYFRDLARFVTDGLNACGFVYCPGDAMATNPQWRQPVRTWRRMFRHWITEPTPKAVMLCSIFFDLKFIEGDEQLFWAFRECVLNNTGSNRIFLAHLAANALRNQPPVGFFRNFVLIDGGEHDDTLNLKKNGVIPIVDLARVYSLERGIHAVNTKGRLQKARDEGMLSPRGARDLLDALEFINLTRIRHQAKQLRIGADPNNYFSPKELSHFERDHLKDAFLIVQTMQSSLEQRYQVSRFL